MTTTELVEYSQGRRFRPWLFGHGHATFRLAFPISLGLQFSAHLVFLEYGRTASNAHLFRDCRLEFRREFWEDRPLGGHWEVAEAYSPDHRRWTLEDGLRLMDGRKEPCDFADKRTLAYLLQDRGVVQ